MLVSTPPTSLPFAGKTFVRSGSGPNHAGSKGEARSLVAPELRGRDAFLPAATGPLKPSGPPAGEEPPEGLGWGKKALLVGLAAASAATALAGIGYFGNREALHSEVSVSLTLEPEVKNPVESPAPAPSAPVRGGVTMLVPHQTTRDFLQQLRQQPNTRRLLRQTLEQAKKTIESELATLKLPDDEVLLEMDLPLPTGERAFFHLGNFDLPSLGVKALQVESVPMALSYETEAINAGLEVNLEIIDSQQPERPAHLDRNAIYLGSVKVEVASPKEGESLRGEARLHLDLEGGATRRVADELRRELDDIEPGSPRAQQIEQELEKLAGRAARGEQLAGQNFTGLLQDAMRDQRLELEVQAGNTRGVLASSTYDFWLGSDLNADGRADVHLSERSDVNNLDNIQLNLSRLEAVGQRPPGRVGGYLNDKVRQGLLDGIRELVPRATQEIRELAKEEVQEQFAEAAPMVQQRVNRELDHLYEQGHLELPAPNDKLARFPIDLGAVVVGPNGVELSLHRGNGPAPAAARFENGEFSLRLDANEFALHLKDRSQPGGMVDWQGLLGQIKEANDLKRLQFGKTPDGRTVYPRLVMRDGQPTLKFDLVATFKGVIRIPDLDPGGIFEGAIGLPGDVIDGIFGRRPIFDATVHTGMEIPIEIGAEEGSLTLRPSTAVKITDPETELPFDPRNLLPTRLISSALTRLIFDLKGGQTIGDRLGEVAVELDLQKYGLEFESVQADGLEGQPPSLTIRAKAETRAAHTVDQVVGKSP